MYLVEVFGPVSLSAPIEAQLRDAAEDVPSHVLDGELDHGGGDLVRQDDLVHPAVSAVAEPDALGDAVAKQQSNWQDAFNLIKPGYKFTPVTFS